MRIIGDTVENRDGEDLGKVRDLMIAVPSGEVEYVIVATGGTLGINPHLKLVPIHSLSLGTAKKRTAFLDISPRRWKNAPAFKRSMISRLPDPEVSKPIERFYETKGNPSDQHSVSALSRAQRSGERSKSAPLLRLATEIIGKRVAAPGQESIGTISDLLVDFEQQKPTFAIVRPTQHPRKEHRLATVFSSLKQIASGRFVFSINPDVREPLREFDANIWAAPETNVFYRYDIPVTDQTAFHGPPQRIDEPLLSTQAAGNSHFRLARN